MFYRFEVATSASFASLAFTNTIAEQPGGQTTFSLAVPANTPAGTYFWRVQATDPSNAVTSAFSSVFSFRFQPFDMRQAIILDSPRDLGSWDETTKITSVSFSPEAFEVDFDRRTGGNRWRDQPFGSGSLQYTLGMCVNPNGNQWYCSAVVQFWFGRELTASTPPSYVGRNWFYDGRWAPIVGYQPQNGETVGLFVGAQPARRGLHRPELPDGLRALERGDGPVAQRRQRVLLVRRQLARRRSVPQALMLMKKGPGISPGPFFTHRTTHHAPTFVVPSHGCRSSVTAAAACSSTCF